MLELPAHLKPMIAMGYWTGMRMGEILGLTWGKVNLTTAKIKLGKDETKERRPKTVPIPQPLLAIIKKLPRGLHTNHVILFKGAPISRSGNITSSVAAACKRAGIKYGRKHPDGLVLHDLRHTFVTNARRAGISQSVIMAITGHSTVEMFARYNRVDEDDLEVAGDFLSKFFEASSKHEKEVKNGPKSK